MESHTNPQTKLLLLWFLKNKERKISHPKEQMIHSLNRVADILFPLQFEEPLREALELVVGGRKAAIDMVKRYTTRVFSFVIK